MSKCKRCNGEGLVMEWVYTADLRDLVEMVCPVCDGVGERNEQKEIEYEIISFMRAAFLVDGEVSIVPEKQNKLFKIDRIVELNDSERGKFYIAKVEKEER